jgi:propanol-preferring alcohol dehydrogenase
MAGGYRFSPSRPGDVKSQEFACQLGAVWASDSDAMPPELLDAAIIFAVVGNLVPLGSTAENDESGSRRPQA